MLPDSAPVTWAHLGQPLEVSKGSGQLSEFQDELANLKNCLTSFLILVRSRMWQLLFCLFGNAPAK